MRRITLPKVHATLRDLRPQVEINRTVAHAARRSLQRMPEFGRREAAA